jgi:uncharacterized protein YqgV (UPF0045/DUF77 family)
MCKLLSVVPFSREEHVNAQIQSVVTFCREQHVNVQIQSVVLFCREQHVNVQIQSVVSFCRKQHVNVQITVICTVLSGRTCKCTNYSHLFRSVVTNLQYNYFVDWNKVNVFSTSITGLWSFCFLILYQFLFVFVCRMN